MLMMIWRTGLIACWAEFITQHTKIRSVTETEPTELKLKMYSLNAQLVTSAALETFFRQNITLETVKDV